MNREEVRALEVEIERAIGPVLEDRFDGLPRSTRHLMAKAAVTVLEAVVQSPPTKRNDRHEHR